MSTHFATSSLSFRNRTLFGNHLTSTNALFTLTNSCVCAKNADRGQVAQLVEQRTENPRVGGSIPSLATKRINGPGLPSWWPFSRAMFVQSYREADQRQLTFREGLLLAPRCPIPFFQNETGEKRKIKYPPPPATAVSHNLNCRSRRSCS